ncbi:MAG: ABC transporter substrate-binding protein [Bacteroidia bacterium]|nr:ABC transporter substrate-binding protein [Bacteroidia bacterium]MDW8015239.1 ABC transporter substrate-binding protein [Bacteroidia bacterium]
MRKVYSQAIAQWLELPDTCQRVVSFSPAISDAIIQMGLGHILKGISVYCVHPTPAIRKGRFIVGSYNSYKREVMERIRPDIVFTTTGYQLDFAQNLAQHYPVYSVRLPLTLTDLIATCTEVGIVCGYYEEAHNLQRKLIAFLSSCVCRSEERRPKAYIEVELGEPITFGAYSYITDALRYAGFKNIFGQYPSEWLRPDTAIIQTQDPDVIIYEPAMFRRSRDIENIKKALTARLGELRAIEEGKVFLTPGIYDFFAHHGPAFVYEVLPFLFEIRNKV